MLAHVEKRDGKILEIYPLGIKAAIAKAAKIKGEFKLKESIALSSKVFDIAHFLSLSPVAEVEAIQNAMEKVLSESLLQRAAKAYILHTG